MKITRTGDRGGTVAENTDSTHAISARRRWAGWLAVALTAAAIAGLVTVMVLAGAASDPAAVDGRVMFASIALLLVAGLVNALSLSLWKQRSVLNIASAVICVGALGLALMLGLGGFFNGVF